VAEVLFPGSIAAFLNDAPSLVVHRTPTNTVTVFDNHSVHKHAPPVRIYSPPVPANDVLPVLATIWRAGSQLDDDKTSITRSARHRFFICRFWKASRGDQAASREANALSRKRLCP
jgi:hypothetical protein